MEHLNRFRGARHVGSFANSDDLVGHEHLGLFAVEFVLRGARKSYVNVNVPQAVHGGLRSAGGEGGGGVFLGVFGNPSAAVVLEVHDEGKFRPVDAFWVVNETGGVRERDGLAPEIEDFLASKLSHVA